MISQTYVLNDFEEHWLPAALPVTEREPTTLLQSHWANDGVVLFDWPEATRREVVDEYAGEWLMYNGGRRAEPGAPATYASPGGWDYATPYMDHPGLLRLACDPGLGHMLEELVGEPMGVHLCLTGWQSTRRDWHRDQYLNTPNVGGFYAAVWLALADIVPDSGPFQFVRASHHGPPLSQSRVRLALGDDGFRNDWPTLSERLLTPLFERQIEDEQLRVETFLPRAYYGLVWHSRLLHRGSIPADPTLERRALIMHFSGINHRPDFPPAVKHDAGGWFFPLNGRQPVR